MWTNQVDGIEEVWDNRLRSFGVAEGSITNGTRSGPSALSTDRPRKYIDMLGIISAETLQGLCVPIDDCVCVPPGNVNLHILKQLEERGFDQAPVWDRSKQILWGLVETSTLRNLVNTGQPLLPKSEFVLDKEVLFEVGYSIQVEVLLERMIHNKAVLVNMTSDATEHGEARWFLGLLTVSDLNRHQVRAELYHMLAHLEAALADILSELIPEPWEWIKHLDERNQVHVLGYWDLSKRRGIDIGPMAATTLSQLIRITERSSSVRKSLGFSTKKELTRLTGEIPDLRNKVMHPVRPLILGNEDIASVLECVKAMRGLLKRISELHGT